MLAASATAANGGVAERKALRGAGSGATGRVDMTYLPEFTLFADMGRDVSA